MFSQQIIEQFYCGAIAPEITTTEYTGELQRCGDQITFFRSPRVTVRRHAKDQTLVHDTISTAPVTLTVDDELVFSVKIAKEDVERICNWSQWNDLIVKNATYEIGQNIDVDVLAEMYADASPQNRGPSAGVLSGVYNLGATGVPVSITSLNIWEYLTYIHAVLMEQCVPDGNDWFIVLPEVARPILLASPLLQNNAGLAGQCCKTTSDIVLNGELPPVIGGLQVYFSKNIGRVFDPGVSAFVYQVPAGWRGSTAFAILVSDTRVMNDKDNFDDYIQGRSIYCKQVMQPEGLAALYARFV
jgi:hypothetical protein